MTSDTSYLSRCMCGEIVVTFGEEGILMNCRFKELM